MALVGCDGLGSKIRAFGGLPVVGRGHFGEQWVVSHHDARWSILPRPRAWVLLSVGGPAVAGARGMHWQLHPFLRSDFLDGTAATLASSSERGP